MIFGFGQSVKPTQIAPPEKEFAAIVDKAEFEEEKASFVKRILGYLPEDPIAKSELFEDTTLVFALILWGWGWYQVHPALLGISVGGVLLFSLLRQVKQLSDDDGGQK